MMMMNAELMLPDLETIPNTLPNFWRRLPIALSHAVDLILGRLLTAAGLVALLVTTACWWFRSPKREKAIVVAGGKSSGQ